MAAARSTTFAPHLTGSPRASTCPILFAGFSFGSNVGLRACCGDARVHGLVGLGLPVRAAGRDYRYDFLPACGSVPKLFISGDHDEFSPRGTLEALPRLRLTTTRDPLHRRRRSFLRRHPRLARESKLDRMSTTLRIWIEKSFGLTPLA